MNILLYSGPGGVSTTGLAHTRRTLRELCPSYDVIPTTAAELALSPWQATTRLIVVPGGRDLPYVEEFAKVRTREDGSHTTAQDEVRRWVSENGGDYVGICAGAYFASSWCSFEEGTKLEVVGPRPGLEFFPGECRGTVYKGFVYESDAGARVVRLDTAQQERIAMHYNGGGAFIHADSVPGVAVLARYPSDDAAIAAPSYAGQAAVIDCQVGAGQAILFGTHPEFSLLPDSRPVKLTAAPETCGAADEDLVQADVARRLFLARCLEKLGLRVQVTAAPSAATSSSDLAAQGKLSSLLLVGPPAALRLCLDSLAQQANASLPHIRDSAGRSPATSTSCTDSLLFSMRDANDTLHFYFGRGKGVAEEVGSICDTAAYNAAVDGEEASFVDAETGEVDLHRVPKYVLTFPTEASNNNGAGAGACGASFNSFPESRHWNSRSYFHHLAETRARLQGDNQEDQAPLGDVILYGERVTSTQTLLDKNPRLTSRLPSGFVAFATHQISGRGRGGNSWISPLGCLQFSLLLHVPTSPTPTAGLNSCPLGTSPMVVGPKLVFVQYLAGLAIVEAVRYGLGEEYAAVGRKMRLKWPNDIYAEVSPPTSNGSNGANGYSSNSNNGTPTTRSAPAFTHLNRPWAKMGGILVNSHYSSGVWSLVVGCGINCLNALPTTSLSALIDDHNAVTGGTLEHVSQERLAGAVLASLQGVWADFLACGGDWTRMPSAFPLSSSSSSSTKPRRSLAQRYRDVWLHSDQPTLLTTVSPPTEVRIVGIAADTGMLRVVPASSAGSSLSSDDDAAWGSARRGGEDEAWQLQPDGNSFDMLKNLIKAKA